MDGEFRFTLQGMEQGLLHLQAIPHQLSLIFFHLLRVGLLNQFVTGRTATHIEAVSLRENAKFARRALLSFCIR